MPGKSQSKAADADGSSAPNSGSDPVSPGKSQHVEKEVETVEQWRRRKMINAGCAVGILSLAGVSFIAPQLSFACALALCVGLPFFRAAQNKEEDHSNV